MIIASDRRSGVYGPFSMLRGKVVAVSGLGSPRASKRSVLNRPLRFLDLEGGLRQCG